MNRSPAVLALQAALAVIAVVALLRWLGVSLLLVALVGALVIVAAPWWGVRLLSELRARWRAAQWAPQQGRHHAFGGIALHIEDDGRHCWIAGADLQRVLHTRDAEDVLAARHAGRWRRDEQGLLLLRVDAVVAHLASAPGRMEPRTLRLRQYLERDVLFPAARRRQR